MIEIYDKCDLCGENNDLIMWKTGAGITIAYACNDCYNILEKHALGKGHTKTRALELAKKEVSDGKK